MYGLEEDLAVYNGTTGKLFSYTADTAIWVVVCDKDGSFKAFPETNLRKQGAGDRRSELNTKTPLAAAVTQPDLLGDAEDVALPDSHPL